MIDDRTAAGFQREMSFKQYKKYKLHMLEVDNCIKLSPEELAHYKTLDTKTKIDQFCVAMWNKYW